MKLLENSELNQVAGGTQYLSITTKIEFEGIPEHCVASFFQANKDNPASFILDNLGWNIIKLCPEFENASKISYSVNEMPISMSLVTL